MSRVKTHIRTLSYSSYYTSNRPLVSFIMFFPNSMAIPKNWIEFYNNSHTAFIDVNKQFFRLYELLACAFMHICSFIHSFKWNRTDFKYMLLHTILTANSIFFRMNQEIILFVEWKWQKTTRYSCTQTAVNTFNNRTYIRKC